MVSMMDTQPALRRVHGAQSKKNSRCSGADSSNTSKDRKVRTIILNTFRYCRDVSRRS